MEQVQLKYGTDLVEFDIGKVYYFSINGQSGKTCGELPVDESKLRMLFLKVFIPAFVIILAICWFLL